MTHHSVKKRLLSWSQYLGLGCVGAAVCSPAALAHHGDTVAVTDVLHTLAHQAAELHLLALLSAGIPIIALRVLATQKRDEQEE